MLVEYWKYEFKELDTSAPIMRNMRPSPEFQKGDIVSAEFEVISINEVEAFKTAILASLKVCRAVHSKVAASSNSSSLIESFGTVMPVLTVKVSIYVVVA